MKGRDTKGADLSLSNKGTMNSVVLGALALAGLVTASAARGEVPLSMIQAKPGSGIDIEMIGFFDALPKSGYAPIKITIRNDSGGAHTWQFSFQSQIYHRGQASVRYDWAARVESGKQRAYEVLVPLVTSPARSYSSLNMSVQGYGVAQGHGMYPGTGSYSGHSIVPFALMSSTLGTASWSELEDELKKRNAEMSGSRFEMSPAWVPSDWRAYAGVASVWLADTDWERLPAPVRAALLQWVAQGGHLFYCAPGATAARMNRAGLPGDGRERIYGLGRISAYAWDDGDMPVHPVANKLLRAGAAANPSHDLLAGYQHVWAPMLTIGETTVNALAIILAVIAFAVVVGPINLIFFASPRRRHRLFWTTPLISFGAAIVLGVIILLHDGLGGRGQRMALALLSPDQRETIHMQEQISLTGVLLAQAFPLDEDACLARIQLDQPGQGRDVDLRLGPGSASGSWFSSRAVQAQFLAAVRPSRARVEVVPAAGADPAVPPVLLSTVEDRLRDVFYVDPAGRYWRAPLLKVGTRTPLVPSTHAEFDRTWWTPNIQTSGLRARGRIESVKGRTGYVFAVADDPPDERFIATHPSIDWENRLVYMGPCVPAGDGRP